MRASAFVVAVALLPAGSPGANTAAALADVQKRFGAGARLLGIHVSADETAIDVQDAAKPGHVDRHRYDTSGAVETEPLAVGRSERQLRARLFPLRDVKPEVLPRILAAAPAAVETDGGVVTHAVLERSEGYGDNASWGPPRWRVHVEGPRGGGYAEFALDGKRKRVMRW